MLSAGFRWSCRHAPLFLRPQPPAHPAARLAAASTPPHCPPVPPTHRTPDEFSHQLQRALKSQPAPLSQQQLHSLTWEAATERFLDIAELRPGQYTPLDAAVDNVLAAAHQLLTGNEHLRLAAGAGAKTRDMPARITDYSPSDSDCRGLFDRRAA